MSLAENLLKSLQFEDSYLEATGQKEEEHIVINELRQIIIPSSLKTIAVTGEKDIEIVTFDCVRYWDNHDLSTFRIFINYILPNGEQKTYEPASNSVSSEDASVFRFNWKITSDMTEKSGNIVFAVVAEDYSDDGTLNYRWSSLRSDGFYVALGIGVSESNSSPTIFLQDKTIKTNGIYTADDGYDGLGTVTVNVENSSPDTEIVLQEKQVTPTKSVQEVVPDSNYTALSKVTVNAIPSEYIKPSDTINITKTGTHDVTQYASAVVIDDDLIASNIREGIDVFGVTGTLHESTLVAEKTITANGTYTPSGGYDGFAKVIVDISGDAPKLTTKNITANGTYAANNDGYTGYSEVTVNVPIPSGYIKPTGTKTITASGTHDVTSYANASVAAGVYSATHTLTSGSGSVSASGTNITLTEASSRPSSGYYITAQGSGIVSATGTATISTAGYLTAGSKSSTSSSKSSNTATKYYSIATETKSVSPTTSTQTITPSSNKLLSSVTVNAVITQSKTATPSTSAQTIYPDSGKFLSSVSINAIPNQKSASDVTVSGATVSVPAGYYSSAVNKSVATVNRASTTLSSFVSNNTLQFIASNNQGTGYVTGSESTANKTVSLSVSGRTITASDGTNSISQSVSSSYVIPSGTKTVNTSGIFDVTNYASVNVAVFDSALPVEINSEYGMERLLDSADSSFVGGVYKYVGEQSNTYQYGALYILTEV